MREIGLGERRLTVWREDAHFRVIRPCDAQERETLDREQQTLDSLFGGEASIVAFPDRDWGEELSPWKAEAVFGDRPFGSGAGETMRSLVEEALPALEKACGSSGAYILCGYSLAGLFALYCACHTHVFSGFAAVSPSVWFPGWTDYAAACLRPEVPVYLSLGDREEKTRHPVMSHVGEAIRAQYALLRAQGNTCTLEWNPGNHFREPDMRCAKGAAWVIREIREKRT